MRARRMGRRDAARAAADDAELLDPLVAVQRQHLLAGLTLFERHDDLGAVDAALAAVALQGDATSLVSADRAFASLEHVIPDDEGAAQLLG